MHCVMNRLLAFSRLIYLSKCLLNRFIDVEIRRNIAHSSFPFQSYVSSRHNTKFFKHPVAFYLLNRKLQAARGDGGVLPSEKIVNQASFDGVDKDLAKRIVEQAEKAIKTWELQVTDFLRPPEYTAFEKIFGSLVDVKVKALGGFEQAERKRLIISRENNMDLDIEALQDSHTKAISIEGNFLFDKADHGDFLGSILGTGIVREKVGDIIITGERGAHVIVSPDIAEWLCMKLSKVRSTPVRCSSISLQELSVSPPIKKQIQSVEASLRIDAVASAGMGMSRSKMADFIKSGNVLVNWKDASSPNKEVKEGDVVTIRGKGRVEIVEITKTSKGKYRILMNKLS